MKEQTKKYLIIGGLFVAVFAFMMARSFRTEQQLANLPDDSVVGTGKPALLELGSHRCNACKQMIPILKELSAEQQVFTVAFVNVLTQEKTSQKYGIEFIPTQIFFDKDGNELFRHVGFYPKADILAKWKELGVEVILSHD